MVCAMHRLFQSEEDDRIMEGEMLPSSSQDEYQNTQYPNTQYQNIHQEVTPKEPAKTTLRSRITKSLGHFIKSKISAQN